MKTFRYRLYPSPSQEKKLLQWLDLNRWLYNCALEERISSYRNRKKSISYKNQSAHLPEIKQLFPEFKDIYSQVLQQTLIRLHLAYKSFFQRVKEGKKKAGFPRFQSWRKYKSFTFPQAGFKISVGKKKWSKVFLSKIGHLSFAMHREMSGTIKTCTIKQQPTGEWYISFACEVDPISLPKTGKETGIDLGCKQYITQSDNTVIDLEKPLKGSLKKLGKAQQKKERKKAAGKELFGAKQHIARIHRKIRHQRKDQLHKISFNLVKEFDLICLEKLDIQGMIDANKAERQPSAYNRSIYDGSWYQLVQMILYKAENAGKECRLVDPVGTTQLCSRCESWATKGIEDRWHYCENCGLSLSRDHNAAINILKRGLLMQTSTIPENGKTFSGSYKNQEAFPN